MISNILFSIVIPTRDRPSLLSRVLLALKAQTFVDFEVIISDNSLNYSCEAEVSSYLSDVRFRYKRPPHPMNMCDHWNFAIEGANGEYITIFNEKFLMRPDALEIMAREVANSEPDILTWQFESFESKRVEKSKFFGEYHPRMKPGEPFNYDPSLELRRRFEFDFPIFTRYNKSKNNYGKIYTGFVRSEILDKVRKKYGKIFFPTSPDFTSMAAILNESRDCVDINRSLMLLHNLTEMSNGEKTRTSFLAARKYIESLGLCMESHSRDLPIEGFCIGHNNYIAADFELIKSIAPDGFIKLLNIDRGSLAFWAMIDLHQITDLRPDELENYQKMLFPILNNMDRRRRNVLEQNALLCATASTSEIYHSGLKPVDDFTPGTSAEALAKIHWKNGLAPPRKSVTKEPMELGFALDYLYRYNLCSQQLLGLG